MTSTLLPSGRPAAWAAAAILFASAVLGATPALADAGDSPLPGVPLPVPATDVSDTDADLASTDREVVVLAEGPDGLVVRKLRTRTEQDAVTLAAELDARPGLSAEVNQSFTLPPEPGETSPAQAGDLHALAAGTIAGEPRGPEEWGMYAVGAEDAWTITHGAGVTVAVVDVGVDVTHPDLASQVAPQVDIVGHGDPLNFHGTHVAGIIGAALNGTGVVGLADRVRILPIRVIGSSGTTDGYSLAQGIDAAIDGGAAVINLSLGGPTDIEAMRVAVAYAVSRGITVVASGGNAYLSGNPVTFPAAYPGVLGVSSVGTAGMPSAWANAGSYIDLAAPGESILSTVPGGAWEVSSGTSMAAAFVSAAAALVRAANPSLTAAQVSGLLTSTAVDDQSGDGWDERLGDGLLAAGEAVRAAAVAPGGIDYAPPTPDPGPTSPTPNPGPTSPAPNPGPTSPPPNPGPSPDPVPPSTVVPAFTTFTVKVTRAGYGNVLAVSADPVHGPASFAFRVQKRAANGTWATLPAVYRVEGAGRTASITLGAGVFRVTVPAAGGYAAGTSAAIALTAPTVRVSVAGDSARTRLLVDVNPDRASGSWRFKVQKHSAKGWRTLSATHRTKGVAQTRTVNLKKGTYRVVVTSRYGFRGTTSTPVTLDR